MIRIANPIYDSVFKYLVEDEFYSAIENRDTAIMQLQQKTKEQRDRLAEQDQMLRAMVSNLVQQGLTVSQIAKLLGRDEDYVKTLL